MDLTTTRPFDYNSLTPTRKGRQRRRGRGRHNDGGVGRGGGISAAAVPLIQPGEEGQAGELFMENGEQYYNGAAAVNQLPRHQQRRESLQFDTTTSTSTTSPSTTAGGGGGGGGGGGDGGESDWGGGGEDGGGGEEEASESELLQIPETLPGRMGRQSAKKHWAVRWVRAITEMLSRLFGGTWVLLTMLGVATALIAFAVDYFIVRLLSVRDESTALMAPFPAYLVWVLLTVGFILLGAALTHVISEDAIGSGIPQMKAILQGTRLFHYLSPRTFASKFAGLTAALGSGLPIGKEGPFVHLASAIGEMLMRLFFQSIHGNALQRLEVLSAACAVGVASNFGAPIGGVLFAIEVTSTYFAVRNYWRGFYSAVVGAFIFRLLAVVVTDERTITALFTTEFDEYPFDMQEMLAFTLLGTISGAVAAMFVYTHRKFTELQTYLSRSNRHWVLRALFGNRYVHTAVFAAIMASAFCPQVIGSFMGLSQRSEINQLFSSKPLRCLDGWESAQGSVVGSLVIFVLLKFFLTAVAVSFPVPTGVFFPVFVVGAGLGRLVGEIMAVWFPTGFSGDAGLTGGAGFANVTNGATGDVTAGCGWDSARHIVPGGYAVVGAAAVAGGVTHTISTSIIVFELTGQIHHILPVMIAVLMSNAIAQRLGPSFYDSVTVLKGLPYLPDLRQGLLYTLTAGGIMRKDVIFLTLRSTYARLNYILKHTEHDSIPLVESKEDRVLIGSVARQVLEGLLYAHMEHLEAAAYMGDGLREEEQRHEHLRKTIDFTGVHMDPSPFQFTEHSSLHKVHTLFSSLGVQHAYVTSVGRLTGVVGGSEIRAAVETFGVRRLESRAARPHPRQQLTFVHTDGEDFTQL